ncbi:DMT family transporter ASCRUDRAFT_109785 [Ascoidea rubescens DSM 1968]|uniref:EamA domain-containing protein n=1 Tax=Ascoidea rubescens DSM 1968 TaxID=1344418 RepID=A0A1D2VD73_9ASCO|nr:hypothetical protein ASCRUDRAFT_109785 [Ascoidea rubescens DSM 1968]ODV59585.1 hypothetical protein ASCRUDRAFT_109785 [Ascoidea rubescens DSM 1968]
MSSHSESAPLLSQNSSTPVPYFNLASTQFPKPGSNKNYINANFFNNFKKKFNKVLSHERRLYLLGLFYLFITVSTWIISLQLNNLLLKTDGDEDNGSGSESGSGNGNSNTDHHNYDKPVFISFFTGSLYALYLVPEFFKILKRLFLNQKVTIFPSYTSDNLGDLNTVRINYTNYFFIIIIISWLYFFYNYAALAALQYTSASNATILNTCTSIFTLILGCILKIEKFNVIKSISVILSVIGIFFLTFLSNHTSATSISNNDNNIVVFYKENAILGNSLVLLSCFCYSVYLLFNQIKIGSTQNHVNDLKSKNFEIVDDESSIFDFSLQNCRVLFGFVGLCTFLTCWPYVMLADFTGLEMFENPFLIKKIFLILFMTSLLTVLSDYFCVLGMLLTSPLTSAISLTTAIPITMLLDSLIYGFSKKSVFYYFGILLIFISFILVNFQNSNEIIINNVEEIIDSEFFGNDNMNDCGHDNDSNDNDNNDNDNDNGIINLVGSSGSYNKNRNKKKNNNVSFNGNDKVNDRGDENRKDIENGGELEIENGGKGKGKSVDLSPILSSISNLKNSPILMVTSPILFSNNLIDNIFNENFDNNQDIPEFSIEESDQKQFLENLTIN